MTATTHPGTAWPAVPGARRRSEPREPATPDRADEAWPLPAERLAALAIAAGDEKAESAAGRLLAAAGASRARLEEAHLILVERLRCRSDDFEATRALRIVERALSETTYPDGPWRWQRELSPRRIRATRRRRARVIRRGRTGPHLLYAAAVYVALRRHRRSEPRPPPVCSLPL